MSKLLYICACLLQSKAKCGDCGHSELHEKTEACDALHCYCVGEESDALRDRFERDWRVRLQLKPKNENNTWKKSLTRQLKDKELR
jgi:hypothetical protein